MTTLHAIILGIVEGLTEFLPISSTAHLILTSHLLGIAEDTFTKSFEIIIQLGAILAVVVLYWRRLISQFELIKKVVVAFIPTAILGLIFYKIVKALLSDTLVVVWTLILGGVLLIIFEWWYSKKHRQYEVTQSADDELVRLSYGKAALIGVFQSIAFVPGVSRAAATIIGGQLLGLSRKAIVEFSFMLAIPTMAAATGLDILKQANSFDAHNIVLLTIGFVVSFIIAIAAIKTFLSYIQKHSFTAFGIYRIVIGILFLLYIISM